MFGKDGADLVVKVPQGTVVTDFDTGAIIADLNTPTSVFIVAHGGVGGRGNSHFSTSIHQAPKFAENGEPGEHRRLKLELKLLADVGLLGFPNVGKSTLISSVSAAKPKIANYPFTTLVPHLGVVYVEEGRNFVMADIPGIIEGASEGVGLGHQFLRHVERTRLLIHILDVGGMSGREPLNDFDVLNRELALYSENLSTLPQIIALNKLDMVSDTEAVDALEAELKGRGHTVYRISAATRKGLRPLIFDVMERIEKLLPPEEPADESSVRITATTPRDDRQWVAEMVEEHLYEVTGKGLERMVAMTDLNNTHALRRLQRTLDRMGVYRKLKALGIEHGDTVRIRGVEFDYADDDLYEEERVMERQRRSRRKRAQAEAETE
jgi:GTP-binding protein